MSDPTLPPVVQHAVQHTPSASRANALQNPPSAESDQGAAPGGITSSRPLIFGILFGVTGALGLPLLWYSPVFTRHEKWLWSVVNTLYTLGLIAIAVAALKVIFDAFEQFQ